MGQIIVECGDGPREGTCGLCGQATCQRAGPRLCLPAGQAPVCRNCGRARAPGLVALLDLIPIAEKVGRVSAHSPLPVPMEILLEMARASEKYYSLAGAESRAA
jgi:hypothetical protein